MPEHGVGTPTDLRALESFLWHDLEREADWTAWLARVMPTPLDGSRAASFKDARTLHCALRSMQALQSGIEVEGSDNAGVAAREVIGRLLRDRGVRPVLDDEDIRFKADKADAVSLLLIELLQAWRTGVWRRFKLCREPTCRASYYDASKPAVKAWCSMNGCGSRNKMRRYRARLVAS